MSGIISNRIVKDGIVLYMDPANPNSYTGTPPTQFSSGWKDLVSMNSGALVGGYSYDSANVAFSVITATSTTSAWISTTNTLSFPDASQYSMEFCVKLRTNASFDFHSLCGNGTTNPWVGIVGSPTSWKFFFRDSNPGGTYSYSVNQTSYNLSQNWVNLAFTVTTDRTIKFYMNGVFISNVLDINGFKPSSTLLNVSRLAGGYYSGVYSYPFQGFISTTRIYNRLLTDVEILQNYNAIKTRFRLS